MPEQGVVYLTPYRWSVSWPYVFDPGAGAHFKWVLCLVQHRHQPQQMHSRLDAKDPYHTLFLGSLFGGVGAYKTRNRQDGHWLVTGSREGGVVGTLTLRCSPRGAGFETGLGKLPVSVFV